MHTGFALQTKLKVSPQLIFTSNMLQVSGMEIEKYINNELARNPALELVNRCHLPSTNENGYTSIAMQVSAIDQLVAQIRLMVERCDLDVAVFLLHSLDEHGYIRVPSKVLAAELGVTTATVERIIRILHRLDPPGIGARDLQECLLIQCDHLASDGTDCFVVRCMLTETWEDFTRHRWQHISRRLGITKQEIDCARQIIFRYCYPYPLLLLEDSNRRNESLHYADLIIHREVNNGDEPFKVEIPEAGNFRLTISTSFENALRNKDCAELTTDTQSWISTSIERARLFIAALNQRWETLRRIGDYLATYQTEYLQRGPLHMKPLTRAAVAKELGLHESTVGRAIRNKVVKLPDGSLIPMCHFFDTSLAAKEAIRQLLIGASEPISDREIAKRLESDGINLARRTVTKYRQQLQILPIYQRQRESVLSSVYGS